MINEKHYPTHPGAEQPPTMCMEIPVEEYEAIKRENAELKDYNIMDIDAMDDERLEKSESGKIQVTRVYIKSEVDKVIADLEESHKKEVGQLLLEIAKLKEHVKSLILDNYLKYKEIRHHKYKRCLALAKIASDNWHIHNYFYAMGKIDFEQKKCERYERHRLKWLAIADKFKESK